MKEKRPYKHILKNLFHEQATELIPLLLPQYQVTLAFEIEIPDLKTTEIASSLDEIPDDAPLTLPKETTQGIVDMVLPGAQITGVIQTEWIEHTGNFERAYRARSDEIDLPTYVLIEVQTEREDKDLPLHFLRNYARMTIHVSDDFMDGFGSVKAEELEDYDEVEDDELEDAVEDDELDDDSKDDYSFERKKERPRGTVITRESRGFDVYPAVLCPFPQHVPPPVREMFQGKVILEFNFRVIRLWEKDAREFLNAHATPIYYLLPVMKNADAGLLGLAIQELAQRFQSDETELGRHLTGMHMMLQESELLSDEEKLKAQEHLKPYAHLIKHDPEDE
jgi:hypothetical protein